MDQQFYVTLPSDASLDHFASNNAAEWTTKLKKPVTLTGPWEVSVCEIQYVNSLFNIGEPQRILVHTIVDFEKQEPGLPSKMVEEHKRYYYRLEIILIVQYYCKLFVISYQNYSDINV